MAKTQYPGEKYILTPIREPTSRPPFIDAVQKEKEMKEMEVRLDHVRECCIEASLEVVNCILSMCHSSWSM